MSVSTRRENDPESPEDDMIEDEPSNRSDHDGPIYVCIPYDAFVITAQILSIATVFLSCLSWVSFIISLLGSLPFQMFWCHRQQKSTLSTVALIAGVCSLSFFCLGLYYMINNTILCNPNNLYVILLETIGVDSRVEDHCPTHIWVGLSFSSGVLWTIAAGCIIYFLKSGRYDKFEEIHNKSERKRIREINKYTNGYKSTTTESETQTIRELKTIPEEVYSSTFSLSEISCPSELSFAC